MLEEFTIAYCPDDIFRTGATFPKKQIYHNVSGGARTERPAEWLPVSTILKTPDGKFWKVSPLRFVLVDGPTNTVKPAKTTASVIVWQRTQETATRPGHRLTAMKVG